jgi:membrane-associated phospholipid phosphatase
MAVWNSGSPAKLHFALAVAGVAVLTLLDQPLRDYALDHRSAFSDKLFGIDHYYGDKWYMLGGISALYFSGLFGGIQEVRKAGLQTAEAWFYTAVFGLAVKEVFGRARPYTNEGRYSFKPFRLEEAHRSFFSGHSSTVFAVSTVMAGQMDNGFWKAGWYAAAALVAGARVYHDQHWLSDITAGALIGYGIGRFVLNRKGVGHVRITGSASAAQPLQVGFAFRF